MRGATLAGAAFCACIEVRPASAISAMNSTRTDATVRRAAECGVDVRWFEVWKLRTFMTITLKEVRYRDSPTNTSRRRSDRAATARRGAAAVRASAPCAAGKPAARRERCRDLQPEAH